MAWAPALKTTVTPVPPKGMGGPLDVAVVLNPRSGDGRAGQRAQVLVAALQHLGRDAKLLETFRPGDAVNLARKATASGAKVVVAVGGDGTLGEVAQGVLEAAGLLTPDFLAGFRDQLTSGSCDWTPPPDLPVFGLLPSGTGNDLARVLGADSDPRMLARAIVGGPSRRLDVGVLALPSATPRVFLNNLAIGYSGVSNWASASMRRWVPATLTYAVGGVVGLALARARPARIVLDGGPPLVVDVFECHVANGPFSGRGITFAPSADPCDGELDIWIMEGRPSALGLGMWVQKAARERLASGPASGELDARVNPPAGVQRLLTRRARHVLFRSRSTVFFHRDGEVGWAAPRSSVEALLLPGCLPLVT